MKTSLRTRLIVLLLALTGVCLTLVGGSNYYAAKSRIMQSLEQYAGMKVTSQANNLGAWIATRLAEVTVMSNTNVMRSGTSQAKLDYLTGENRRGAAPTVSLGFADRNGKMLLTSGKVIDVGEEATYREALGGNSVVSDPFISKDDTAYFIFTIRVPVYAMDNTIVGVLSAAFLVDDTLKPFADFTLGLNDHVYVEQQDATVIYEANGKQVDRSASYIEDLVSARDESGSFQSGNRTVFYAKVAHTGWKIALEAPTNELRRPVATLFWITALAVLLAELLLALLVYVILTREMRRIRGILTVTEQVASGDLDAGKLRDAGDDEIGALARSVNGMAANLRNMFERLEAILNQNDYAIVGTDANFVISYFNAKAESMLGLKAEDVIGKQTPLVFHDPDLLEAKAARKSAETEVTIQEAVDLLRRKLQHQRSYDEEREYVHRDGTLIPVTLNVTRMVDPDGRMTGTVGIFRDITEQKRIQADLLRAKDEADEANRAKSDFLARMSHEIRTPLNGIIGLQQLLRNTELSELQLDYVEKMSASSHALLQIITDILDFSKIEAGMVQMESVRFRPDELIRRLAGTVGVLLGSRQLDVIFDVPAAVPDVLIGDPLRLEQVLLNLCSNAIKFTHEGFIAIKLEVAHLPSMQAALRFSVEDSGIGISQEQLAKLFVPFTQADGSTNRKYGGTGLGLVITRHYIERMGGQLDVSSAIGHGSTFSFALPFVLPPELPESPTVSPGLPLPPPLRALLVEDSARMRRHLAGMLAQIGLVPEPVDSWREALRELLTDDGRRFGYAFVDMEAPDMYGSDTWQTFKAEADRAGVLVLAVTTAYGREELLRQPERYRPAAIVVKPLTRSSLIRCLHALLLGRQAEREASAGALLPVSAQPGFAAATSGIRILLAEDNAINQEVAVGLLAMQGHTVRVVRTGREALDLLARDAEWDVVLMDIHMPEMDGYEATAAIRANPRWARLPIIAMTADVQKLSSDRCRALGMNGLVTKPFHAEALYAAIAEATFYRRERLESARDAVRQKPPVGPDHPRLAAVIGIDLEEALERVNYRETILLRMLQLFAAEYRDFIARLRDTLGRGDRDAAWKLLHTLKGAAANLSALPLVAETEAAETALMRGELDDRPDVKLGGLEAALEPLVRSAAAL
ncbi:response regulator [Paenibacillus cymbidii]|uniref:response regulator n=1 Tax=Paenibacillus cymbidii TaxID=1639034 RepID=UPI0010819CC5|nr:response regulator [Paenibacillus cymbidii]